jgi:hypothetical protein
MALRQIASWEMSTAGLSQQLKCLVWWSEWLDRPIHLIQDTKRSIDYRGQTDLTCRMKRAVHPVGYCNRCACSWAEYPLLSSVKLRTSSYILRSSRLILHYARSVETWSVVTFDTLICLRLTEQSKYSDTAKTSWHWTLLLIDVILYITPSNISPERLPIGNETMSLLSLPASNLCLILISGLFLQCNIHNYFLRVLHRNRSRILDCVLQGRLTMTSYLFSFCCID